MKLKNKVSLSEEGLKYLNHEIEGTPKNETPLPLKLQPSQKLEKKRKLKEEMMVNDFICCSLRISSLLRCNIFKK